jgi:hypothetical protein
MLVNEAVAGLVAAFERIATTRMAGLALNNPALRLQAVGFRPQEKGHLIGVLITPGRSTWSCWRRPVARIHLPPTAAATGLSVRLLRIHGWRGA